MGEIPHPVTFQNCELAFSLRNICNILTGRTNSAVHMRPLLLICDVIIEFPITSRVASPQNRLISRAIRITC
jgi:hypothetical protein